jgi:hypothetical protein
MPFHDGVHGQFKMDGDAAQAQIKRAKRRLGFALALRLSNRVHGLPLDKVDDLVARARADLQAARTAFDDAECGYAGTAILLAVANGGYDADVDDIVQELKGTADSPHGRKI